MATSRISNFPGVPGGTSNAYLGHPFGGSGGTNASFPPTQNDMMQQYLYQQQLLGAAQPSSIRGQVKMKAFAQKPPIIYSFRGKSDTGGYLWVNTLLNLISLQDDGYKVKIVVVYKVQRWQRDGIFIHKESQILKSRDFLRLG